MHLTEASAEHKCPRTYITKTKRVHRRLKLTSEIIKRPQVPTLTFQKQTERVFSTFFSSTGSLPRLSFKTRNAVSSSSVSRRMSSAEKQASRTYHDGHSESYFGALKRNNNNKKKHSLATLSKLSPQTTGVRYA